jgi:glycosyltransferase involved in cell wall biosynthesis
VPFRVLHLLSQRPGRTGSGITLEAWVREAAARGYEQDVVVGVPADHDGGRLAGLDASRVHPSRFQTEALPFAVVGMSDVMPYESAVWSALSGREVLRYRDAWRRHLARVIDATRPDLIHAHHLWVLSALVKDVAPEVPLVIQSHATGLRQMELCPHLAADVIRGCGRAERVAALSTTNAQDIARATGWTADRIRVVGAGYREDLFHDRAGAPRRPEDLLYVGKYSRAKGLPWLLDAFERLAPQRPRLRLHVAGDAAGAEGRSLEARVRTRGERVVVHGHLGQAALADLMRSVGVLVLPSLYEGLPLVLVEGVASGCGAVATRLGVLERDLAPHLGAALDLVPPPRLRAVDDPLPEDLPRFVDGLARAIERALARRGEGTRPDLSTFTWSAAFSRLERVWAEARRCTGVARGAGDR